MMLPKSKTTPYCRGISSDECYPFTVSVCIGTFNQARYLKECIDSVIGQTYPISEIWVSDDASTDNTPEIMAEICRFNPKVLYHRQATNRGISGNLSWVLSQPTTDLIVRLDSDDSLEPNFVEVLAKLLFEYPQAGFAHGEIFEVDGHGVRTRTRRLSRTQVYESPEQNIRRSAFGYRVAANCILYRSEALRQTDYYLPNLSWKSGEDWDLCLRIAINGWGNVHAKTPLANYRVWSDSNLSRFKRKISEAGNLVDVYRGTLEPEYLKRGWDTAILGRCMRKRALGFVNDIDSELFSVAEREELKEAVRRLGDSPWLSTRIFLAERGFNPIFRFKDLIRARTKNLIKNCLRVTKLAIKR